MGEKRIDELICWKVRWKSKIEGELRRRSFVHYYKPKEYPSKKGKEKSKFTVIDDGQLISNEQVVEQISDLLSEEFVDYAYLKVGYHEKEKTRAS